MRPAVFVLLAISPGAEEPQPIAAAARSRRPLTPPAPLAHHPTLLHSHNPPAFSREHSRTPSASCCPTPIAMDECQGDLPAAVDAAVPVVERAEDSEINDSDPCLTASASSDADDAVSLPRQLSVRSDAPRCDVCHESLDGGWPAAAGAADSRMPRMLPCGHSWCTSCIQKSLDANRG